MAAFWRDGVFAGVLLDEALDEALFAAAFEDELLVASFADELLVMALDRELHAAARAGFDGPGFFLGGASIDDDVDAESSSDDSCSDEELVLSEKSETSSESDMGTGRVGFAVGVATFADFLGNFGVFVVLLGLF